MMKPKLYKPIVQKDLFGCGIACTAFVLGLNYQAALKLFKRGKHKARHYGFWGKEIVGALNSRGNNFEYKYINNKIRRKIYQNHTIVFIKRSKAYPVGHYFCRYKNLWMDSWINFQRNKNIQKVKAGFRKKLPGKAVYAVLLRQKQ